MSPNTILDKWEKTSWIIEHQEKASTSNGLGATSLATPPCGRVNISTDSVLMPAFMGMDMGEVETSYIEDLKAR